MLLYYSSRIKPNKTTMIYIDYKRECVLRHTLFIYIFFKLVISVSIAVKLFE